MEPKITKDYPRAQVRYPVRDLKEANDSFLHECSYEKRHTVMQAIRNATRTQMPGVKFTIRQVYDDNGEFVGVRATRLSGATHG